MEQIKAGFAVRKTYEGIKEFDQDYVEIELKKVVQKTGDGEDDFILVDKEIKHLTPIADKIASQESEVGIESYIAQCQAEHLNPRVVVSDEVNDFTNMPEDLASAASLGDAATNLFNKLDPELVGGLSIDEFLATMTIDKIKEFYATKKSVISKKDEKVEDTK